jgi:hypothetical protein
MKRTLTQEQVSGLGASAINKALDTLGKKQSKLIDNLIEAGLGHVGLQKILIMDHPVAKQYAQVNDQIALLRREIERRYGPGAPSRLPPGFGPLR